MSGFRMGSAAALCRSATPSREGRMCLCPQMIFTLRLRALAGAIRIVFSRQDAKAQSGVGAGRGSAAAPCSVFSGNVSK